jgi:integrase
VPLNHKTPSLVLARGRKWIGPMWSQIDEHLILRYTAAKTQFTSGAQVTLDLNVCPMVLAELANVPAEVRHGPLIVNPSTGFPYTEAQYHDLWRKAARAAGIRREVWSRDMRAGGATEGRKAAALIDDLAKTMGHSNTRTTAEIYDRDRVEAHRRVARARVAYRNKNEGGT